MNEWRGIARTNIKRDEFERRGSREEEDGDIFRVQWEGERRGRERWGEIERSERSSGVREDVIVILDL